MSKSYLCVCARHFYRKPIQMFRTTRVVSRMARRVMIDVRRVRKAIRMVNIPRMVTVPWMVTIPRTDTICSQDVLNYLEYRRWAQGGQIKFVGEMLHLGVFCLAEQYHTQSFQVLFTPIFLTICRPLSFLAAMSSSRSDVVTYFVRPCFCAFVCPFFSFGVLGVCSWECIWNVI